MPARYLSDLAVMTTFEPDLPALDRRRLRRLYLAANVFELLIGIAGVIGGVTFLIDQGAASQTAVGESLDPYNWAWNMLYLFGGLSLVAGLLWPSPRLELAALCVFGSAIIGNIVAIVLTRGITGAPSALTYVAIVIAFYVRGRLILVATRARADMTQRFKT